MPAIQLLCGNEGPCAEMKDGEIVAAIVAGDPAGLAGAYDKYGESLYGYCGWLLGGPGRAADAVQDTFVIAAASLGGLADPGRLRPWLYAVARSECHRRLRAGETGPDEAAALAGRSDAGGNAWRAELRGLVRAAMDGLSPGEREVIELGFRHDLSGADLAAVLGVSRNQAHALASRARGRLERELGVLLVARTGRWTCPVLDVMLYDWDGQMGAPVRKQVARHVGQCDACAYRRRSALRPAVLAGMAALAVLPRGLREKVLALYGDGGPLGQAYREEVTQRAGPFRANGFPQQFKQPRSRMIALFAGTAASGILIAIAATAVITVLASGGARTPRQAGDTGSRSASAAAGAARVSPSVSPAAHQPATSAPPPAVMPSVSQVAMSSRSAVPSPPPRPSASTSSACPHPLPHHRCHRSGRP